MAGNVSQISTKSPYTGPMIMFMFGNTRKAYYIPRDFLQNSDWINQSQYNHNVLVPHLSEDVGHVIIHYMYTGEYQVLKKYYAGILMSDNKEELRMALTVLFASETYHLTGLNELAKSEIIRLRAAFPISIILQAVDELFRVSSFAPAIASKKWVKDYLKSQIREEFKKDEFSFDSGSMFLPLLDIDLIKTVASSLTIIYRERIQELNREVSKFKLNEHETESTMTLTPVNSSGESEHNTRVGSPTSPVSLASGNVP
ncbi:hypothetical protein OnM2_079027 [Erysiphe neolycopersici]|uniref:BTB domain-containing protein n=1 Tax=Erysiphe neolycopersici TaxID=212602 RepID=A0A420HGR1_9PEZI|nr:hypothetical protein OnM2_079027 [Erysiphe neolycopersici]